MGKMSRDKGARFERELAKIFRDYGYKDSQRTAQHCGKNGGKPDVTGLPGIHVEAKHQEKMQLYDWMDQAKRDAAAGAEKKLPAVFHKKNRSDILVTMRLEDWMEIYRKYEFGMEMKEGEKYGGAPYVCENNN